eukprot:TRINITY_DN1671_c1_g3_i1.p1 TRINITY_DN1671_c1_g3~~TRINITY_DN1671_c1_g3_i1.p1  ORF type:complete len:259 (-),score=41.25 TRINITY_DN1671_c1_g3_i1:625-1365(-)
MATDAQLPYRQIRAVFDEDTITVYQAYNDAIADVALEKQTFDKPWRPERMTWVKPSFLWMMYRCRYASKKDQERVLAIRLHKAGFAEALSRSCPTMHGVMDQSEFATRLKEQPVRVQWDPERSLTFADTGVRSIQIGISKDASADFVSKWISSIEDVTALAKQIGALVAAGDYAAATALLPVERVYDAELTPELREHIGMNETRAPMHELAQQLSAEEVQQRRTAKTERRKQAAEVNQAQMTEGGF